MKYKKTSVKVNTQTDTYHLTDELKYRIHFKNGKETGRDLHYTGKKHNGYELRPMYKEDISLLKSWNPCWGENETINGYKWLEEDTLPDINDIDISKIIYLQFSTHSFFDINKEPIPVVLHGDYICECLNDYFYDLNELSKYLKNHPNIVKCSDILDIPYYSKGPNKTKYIDVLFLPTLEMYKKVYALSNFSTDDFWYKPYNESTFDFLGIKQFVKRTELDY